MHMQTTTATKQKRKAGGKEGRKEGKKKRKEKISASYVVTTQQRTLKNSSY